MIWYDRADRAEAKASNYRLVEVADSKGLLASLTAALGIRSVVRKRQRIYWHRNVRIHLDDVEGAGNFLEFEAVISNPADEPASRQLVDELASRFHLTSDDLLRGSYGDMLAGPECHGGHSLQRHAAPEL